MTDSTLTHADRKRYAGLHRAKGRRGEGAFLLEGTRSITAALDSGADVLDLLIAPSVDPDLHLRLRGSDIRLIEGTERDVADASVVQTHQGAIARVRIPNVDEALLTDAARILVLDGIQDPGNVGTLIRTAAWFGMDAVVSDRDTADFWAPKTVRSTMGGIFDIPLARLDDLTSFLRNRAETGEVVGAAMGGVAVGQWSPGERCVLVMGSEGSGLSASVERRLTQRVHIPGDAGRRGTESLNVAVAGGIVMARLAHMRSVS